MYPSLFGALLGINLAERRRLRTAAARATWATLRAWLEDRASIAAMHAAGFRFAVKEPGATRDHGYPEGRGAL